MAPHPNAKPPTIFCTLLIVSAPFSSAAPEGPGVEASGLEPGGPSKAGEGAGAFSFFDFLLGAGAGTFREVSFPEASLVQKQEVILQVESS
ncbi:hypothetical protein SLE2022_145360 [Rubroshorea leprosula]